MDIRRIAINGTTIQNVDEVRIVSGRYDGAEGIAESIVVEFRIGGIVAFDVCVLTDTPVKLSHVSTVDVVLPPIPVEGKAA